MCLAIRHRYHILALAHHTSLCYVMQETIIKEYQNYKFQQPYQQAMYYCSLVLQDHYWPWMEQLEVLPCIDADSLSKFVPMMLSKAFLECYIAGLCCNDFLKWCSFSPNFVQWFATYDQAFSREHRAGRGRVNNCAD